jgi:ribose transport system permease protein
MTGSRSSVLIGVVRRLVARDPLPLVALVLFASLAVTTPHFSSVSNLRNIAIQSSPLVIAAVGMTFVVLTAGIDLSVGATLFLCGSVETGTALAGAPTALIFGCAVLAAALVGLVNGLGVAIAAVPALIVTLAAQLIWRGVAGHITGQQSLIVADRLRTVGTGKLLGIPWPILVAIAVAAAAHFTLRRTVFGRYVQAVGSSPSASRDAGLPIRRVLIAVYVLAGVLAGICALIQVGRLGAVQPTVGQGFELTVITAVVLGGTSLFGGRGNISGTVLGCLILTIVENGLVLTGTSLYVFDIVRAAVLLTAVLVATIHRGSVPAVLARIHRTAQPRRP